MESRCYLLLLVLIFCSGPVVEVHSQGQPCSTNFTSFSGMIESPQNPTDGTVESHLTNKSCSLSEWKITIPYPYANVIKLTYIEFDIHDNNCDGGDVLTYFYTGWIGSKESICRPEGKLPQSEVINLGNQHQMTLQFIPDEANNNTGSRKGFKINFTAVCDNDTHHLGVIQDSFEIQPPPRNSPLAGCRYKWQIQDPDDLDVSEKTMVIVTVRTYDSTTVSPITDGWMIWNFERNEIWISIGACQIGYLLFYLKINDEPLTSLITCRRYENITVEFSLPVGRSQPATETRLNFTRASEEECGCLLKPCINGGLCTDEADTLVCVCEPPFKGPKCEEIETQDQYCDSGPDSYPESGVNWNRTKTGNTDTQICSTGSATRPCLVVGGVAQWGQPDFSDCVSQLFADIYNTAKLLSEATQVESKSILNITSALILATDLETNKQMFAGDLNAATNTLETISRLVAKLDNGDSVSDIARGYGDAVGNVVDPATSSVWRFTHYGYLESRLTSLFDAMETLTSNMASKATELLPRNIQKDVTTSHSIGVTTKNLAFEVRMLGVEDLSAVVYSGNDTAAEITLPKTVFRRALQRKKDSYVHVYNAKFSSISELLKQTHQKAQRVANSSTPWVNSDILSSKVIGVNQEEFSSLTDPVKLVFWLKNSTRSKILSPQCVFLNMSAMTDDNRWLKNGCRRSESESNESVTVCYCDHLTNFAVLMDIYDIEDSIDELDSEILTYLSYAGGALSIIGCILAIIIFEFFRLKNERVRIHEQLALTIILVQIFFLVGIDRTENRYVCMAMAICLHYFLVAMFCWMLVEGAHLYLMLVKVFQSGSHMKKYVAIGWGIPLVLVGISAGIFHDDYGTGNICWLTKKILLVAFVPAVALVIVINTVILLIVMKIMMTSLSKGSKSSSVDRSSVKIGLKAAAVLLPLLGLTWTFGFLSITSEETLIFTYLFTLFNSMQGVFFFVFHCLLSVDVQNAYDRRSRRKSHLKLTETSISKQHSRKSSDSGGLSKHSINTLMTEMASTLERRRSNRNSYSSIDRPQSVTFDDEVFLTEDAPVSRNSFHSNSSRRSFHDIVRSSPMPALEKVQGYRNNVLNNSARSNGSVSSDGYLFYYGKDRKALNEMDIYDYDKNQLYATVNK